MEIRRLARTRRPDRQDDPVSEHDRPRGMVARSPGAKEPGATGPTVPQPALYDTTLRDGTQRRGVNLTVDDKLKVARRMDELGVHFIEGGWPGANPKDTEFFRRAGDGELVLERATLAAFGATRHPRKTVEDDLMLRALLDARTPVVCVVGKSWGYHVEGALGVSRAQNLAMVAETVAFLKSAGRRVFFDAEHFFDGYARDRTYTREVALEAAEAGADCVVLCDTNGGAMPWAVQAAVADMVAALPCDVGVHFHDDGGCAVANSLISVEVGAVHVQGTANGLGERCGNANLFTVLADLQLKRGVELVPPERLLHMTTVAHAVAELCNQAPPIGQPYVGSGAFAHKAGLHVSALAKAADMYQHVDPSLVGNHQRLVVSELAGRATIALKARALGLELDEGTSAHVLDEVKRREHLGWSYDAADASFALLLLRLTDRLGAEPFRLQHFRVTVGGGGAGSNAEAMVAVDIRGERRLGAGEGNGPVDALDHAFRNAANGTWPDLDRVHLADYKVRILEASQGTDAVTRVLVTTTDGKETWDTVGVHPNIVEASWIALADAYVWALVRHSWITGAVG
ncbi:MAG: citramalate synthase [Actinomycetota bacterium]|nr:citramalate synthase [Actinomycetota bacterium]